MRKSKLILTPVSSGAGASSPQAFMVMGSDNFPHHETSVQALSRAIQDCPQRSAGSFNIVHPLRRALVMGSEHRSASSIVADSEEDEAMVYAGNMVQSADHISARTASSPLQLLLFGAVNSSNTWEDQPLFNTIAMSQGMSSADDQSMSSCTSTKLFSHGQQPDLQKAASNRWTSYCEEEDSCFAGVMPGYMSDKESSLAMAQMTKGIEEDAGLAPPYLHDDQEDSCESDRMIYDYQKEIKMDNTQTYLLSSANLSEAFGSESVSDHVIKFFLKGKFLTGYGAHHEDRNMLNRESDQVQAAPNSSAIDQSTLMQSLAHTGSSVSMDEGSGGSSVTCVSGDGGTIERKHRLRGSCSPAYSHGGLEKENAEQSSSSLQRASASMIRKKRPFCTDELNYNGGDAKSVNQGTNKKHQQQRKVQKRHGGSADPQRNKAPSPRREEISRKLRMLQSLVPNGKKLDTVSMLEQTLEYIRFLQDQLGELAD